MNKLGGVLNGTRGNLSRTKEYRAWSGMIHRCYHPSYKLFHRYGGRNIKVCKRWLGARGFHNFLKDMGTCPYTKTSLDRYPNNDGDYKPSNCRWADDKEQSNNRSSNFLVTIDGVTKNVSQWGIILGMSSSVIYARINKLGWPIRKALTAPIRKINRS